jgi:periplasmic protein TonB
MTFITSPHGTDGDIYSRNSKRMNRSKKAFCIRFCKILIQGYMEPKKSKSADLQNKSFLFFNVGLVVSLSLTILAFNYKVYDDAGGVDLSQKTAVIEEIMEPPVTEQVAPPPPELTQPEVIEVPNEEKIEEDIKINMDIETHIDQKLAELGPITAPVMEDEKEDPHQIFIVVEETAAPIGGMPAFYDFVKSNLKYPAAAKRMDIEGRVFVQFIVEKDGTMTDVQAIKGIGGGCDEEAIRVVATSPKWKPAKQRGKAVRQRMILPITFILSK